MSTDTEQPDKLKATNGTSDRSSDLITSTFKQSLGQASKKAKMDAKVEITKIKATASRLDILSIDYSGFEFKESVELIRSLTKLLLPTPKPSSFVLPRKTRSSPKITLVLDLDETLVHCYTSLQTNNAEISFPITVAEITYYVNGKLRPYCLEFLTYCSNHFEVVLFTASQKIYAQTLAKIIDPTGSLFRFKLYRDSCTNVAGHFIKNLDSLGRDLSQTVIVDNSIPCFGFHLKNVSCN